MTKSRAVLLVLTLAGVAALGGALATAGSSAGARQSQVPAKTGAAGIDPRTGGFEIALGEWALTPEARAIRPGRVTFVIANRGRFRHGFELEIRRVDERHDGDHDDNAKSVKLAPGEKTTLTLDLAPGVYAIECFISHHDEMGMRGVLEVRADAPLLRPRTATSRATVDIAGFAFKPATLRTTVGTTVTWRNVDPAPHTATGKQFSSPQLGKGASFRRRFMQPGTYAYVCALHPGMRGTVVVSRGRAS
jgi:plastocyanin